MTVTRGRVNLTTNIVLETNWPKKENKKCQWRFFFFFLRVTLLHCEASIYFRLVRKVRAN